MGTITHYGDSQTPTMAVTSRTNRGGAQAAKFIGLTVGHVVAAKIYNPKTRKEETHLAFVFNELTEEPEVLFLPQLEIRQASPAITDSVADRVRRFPEFIQGIREKFFTRKAEKEAEAAAEEAGDVEEV